MRPPPPNYVLPCKIRGPLCVFTGGSENSLFVISTNGSFYEIEYLVPESNSDIPNSMTCHGEYVWSWAVADIPECPPDRRLSLPNISPPENFLENRKPVSIPAVVNCEGEVVGKRIGKKLMIIYSKSTLI